MKKILLIGAMLVLGAVSFGKDYILQETSTKTYDGKATMKLIVDGKAISPVAGAYLEIVPVMSKGPNGTSMEFRFGDLKPGEVAVTEGSFYAEVKEYNSKGDTAPNTLKFNSVSQVANPKGDGEIYVGLRKGGALAETATSEVYTAASSGTASGTPDATITYDLLGTSGLTGNNDRYEGYIKSTVAVADDATTGDFYDTGVALVIQVSNITGKRQHP